MKVQGTPFMHVSIQFRELGLNEKRKIQRINYEIHNYYGKYQIGLFSFFM